MAKLISLEGATVVVPSGWTASAGFYTTGYISQNGPGAIINDTEAYGIAIGYAVFYDEGGTELQADSNNLTTMSAGGMWGQMVHYHNETLTITNIANGLETNETFIQWLLDNNAQITGGVWEDESPQITDLTGAKLKFLDVTNLENGTWQINFKTNNKLFTTLTVEDEDAGQKEYSITINSDYADHTGMYVLFNDKPTSIKAGETLTFYGTVFTNCDVECIGADLKYEENESISNSPGQFVPELGTKSYMFTLSNVTNDVVITFVDGNMLSNGNK